MISNLAYLWAGKIDIRAHLKKVFLPGIATKATTDWPNPALDARNKSSKYMPYSSGLFLTAELNLNQIPFLEMCSSL